MPTSVVCETETRDSIATKIIDAIARTPIMTSGEFLVDVSHLLSY